MCMPMTEVVGEILRDDDDFSFNCEQCCMECGGECRWTILVVDSYWREEYPVPPPIIVDRVVQTLILGSLEKIGETRKATHKK
jgi:hypothetical protein